MFAAAGQRVAEKSYGLGEEGGDWGGQPGALVCQTGRFSLQRLQIMIAADLIGHRRSKHEVRASQLIWISIWKSAQYKKGKQNILSYVIKNTFVSTIWFNSL